jgi:bifunctional DNA-binding transcriptional regulator/antitoxin component of YhaV-PrlF toxin-antitoxin module
MGEKSTIARANTKSPSVRTTIPKVIAEGFGFRVGDILDWEVVAPEKGRIYLKVSKLVKE